MSHRLTLSNDRFKELERRRNMEIEGFKTDIKMLRQKLKYVEKQLFRVSKKLEQVPSTWQNSHFSIR